MADTVKSDHEALLTEANRLTEQRDVREAELRATDKGTTTYSIAKRRFDSAMQELADFRSYWRKIGEVTGQRTGVVVQNNTEV